MRLPRTPHMNIERPGLSGSLRRRQNDDDSTIVDVSGYSVASILIITFFVIACLTTLLVTAYCVLSRRYDARAAAAASRFWPRSRNTSTPEGKPDANRSEKKIIGERRDGRKKEKRSPTMVFHQHEPEAHGYFAPLYFEGPERPSDPPLGDVKREVSRFYEPEMLERALTREKGAKEDAIGDWKEMKG